ncbi:type III restriction enzyme, res subunit [Halobacteriovorax sp. BALOs_7]|nr:type III restriction enzyme, res subunit [Halobacteriovorax sp. BALOs_7]
MGMSFKATLSQIVNREHSFTLLMAPMGWGKTRLIWEFVEDFDRIIIVSPLRSILEDLKDRDCVVNNISDKGVFLTTVESFSKNDLDFALRSNSLFVLDEFHLFYEWGETFRPRLLEFLYKISSSNTKVIGLSATITDELYRIIERDVENNFKHFCLLNIGNFQKKNMYKKKDVVIRPLLLLKLLWRQLFFSQGRTILFCSTRKEVFMWDRFFSRLGLSCDYCVGGEVKDFIARECEAPAQIVIATSALSHGVNLRGIENIYISYCPNESTNFQMIGRGGRFGEEFQYVGTKEVGNSWFARIHYKICDYLFIMTKDVLLWLN